MLRAKIYVNADELDDIRIYNMGKQNKEGKTLYKVKDPTKDYFIIIDVLTVGKYC